MKLATIAIENAQFVAVVDADRSVYLPLAQLSRDYAGLDMIGVISKSLSFPLPSVGSFGGRPLSRDSLCAPIARPPQNMLCVGKNYHEHAREFSQSGFDAGATASETNPECPIVFTKAYTSIASPDADLPLWAGMSENVDYEGELGVVIGKPGRSISRDYATQHIFGYTVINDVTARDLQKKHKQWFLAKSIEGYCPTGPWIVTADELNGKPLRIQTRVNGEMRQNALSSEMIFDVSTLISVISQSTALSPGDIIATGTPAGVGIGFSPPRFLREGDVVEVNITGIGSIRNKVVRKAPGAVTN